MRKTAITQTTRNRFVISSPFTNLGNLTQDELTEICRRLASASNFQMLHRTAKLIQNPIGRYYEALSLNRWGSISPEFYYLLNVSDSYRARTILSAGQSHRHQGQIDYAVSAQCEATRLAYSQNDYITFLHAQRELAILSSIKGDHKSALSRLESLLPLTKKLSYGFPVPYYDLFNSLAVELSELSRVEEAWRVLQIALASPFAKNYAPCRETRAELMEKRLRASRSVVAVIIAPIKGENVLLGKFPAVSRVPYVSPGDNKEVTHIGKHRMDNKKSKEKAPIKSTKRSENLAEAMRLLLDSKDEVVADTLERLRKANAEGADES